MTYGLKVWNSAGVEVLNLANNTGLIIAQFNYGPLTTSGGYQYIVTNNDFVGCTAFTVPTRTRMFTNSNATIVGNQLITRIQCTADGSGGATATYVAVYVIDPGSL
jgi:hypothetical protein